jgi:hypothetical protein
MDWAKLERGAGEWFCGMGLSIVGGEFVVMGEETKGDSASHGVRVLGWEKKKKEQREQEAEVRRQREKKEKRKSRILVLEQRRKDVGEVQKNLGRKKKKRCGRRIRILLKEQRLKGTMWVGCLRKNSKERKNRDRKGKGENWKAYR